MRLGIPRRAFEAPDRTPAATSLSAVFGFARQPILLDLDGNGIRITEQSRAGMFVDAGGDGLLHRTAWAGAGDGVLFYDAGGTRAITEKRQYVFTEWGERRKRNGPVDRFRQRTRRAPTATDDLAEYLAALHSRRLSVVSKGALS